MKVKNEKQYRKKRRHLRVKKKVSGTPSRPRLCVFKSAHHIYAQVIDDVGGITIASASSLKLGKLKAEGSESTKILQAKEVGRMIAEHAKGKGVASVSFDRGGYLYHGRVAALAAAARENGLSF